MPQDTRTFAVFLRRFEKEILSDWLHAQLHAQTLRPDLLSEADLRKQSAEFLSALVEANPTAGTDIHAESWATVRAFLDQLSRSRAQAGFSPTETATFVFSLKEAIFHLLRRECGNDAAALAEQTWNASRLLDALGLYTTEIYQKSRQEIIHRQQQELLELSTPVVKLWDGILALPLIGTLDSERTQVVMENLLGRIVTTGAGIAILDITGVPTVDTLVAQHLLKTVSAARLMGTECIISGIRPAIAQTLVHLGVDLSAVITKASLADAFALALQRLSMGIVRNETRR